MHFHTRKSRQTSYLLKKLCLRVSGDEKCQRERDKNRLEQDMNQFITSVSKGKSSNMRIIKLPIFIAKIVLVIYHFLSGSLDLSSAPEFSN